MVVVVHCAGTGAGLFVFVLMLVLVLVLSRRIRRFVARGGFCAVLGWVVLRTVLCVVVLRVVCCAFFLGGGDPGLGRAVLCRALFRRMVRCCVLARLVVSCAAMLCPAPVL